MNERLMKTVEQNIVGTTMDYIIEKKFKSKKNKVELIHNLKTGDKFVRKMFLSGYSRKTKEVFLLKLLKEQGLHVPRLIYEGTGDINLEYISQVTLLDYFISVENKSLCNNRDERILQVFRHVFMWLEDFYKMTYEAMGNGYIVNDINFRNFLLRDDMQIYGIDFEDSIIGRKEVDGGKFCAFLLTYDPIFTKWKIHITQKLIKILINEFKYEREMIIHEIESELERINKRRWSGDNNERIREVISLIKETYLP